MRLIDANALMNFCNNSRDKTIDANDIARFPSVDTEPVRHGRWLKGCCFVFGKPECVEWICSVCDEAEWRTSCDRMKYCMFCGAKMDLKEDG